MSTSKPIMDKHGKGCIRLYSWFLEPIPNTTDRRWSGNVRVWGLRAPIATKWWRSCSIVERVSSKQLKTRLDTTVILQTPISENFALKANMSISAIHKFRDGFPSAWKAVLQLSFNSTSPSAQSAKVAKASQPQSAASILKKPSSPGQDILTRKRKRVQFDLNLRPMDSINSPTKRCQESFNSMQSSNPSEYTIPFLVEHCAKKDAVDILSHAKNCAKPKSSTGRIQGNAKTNPIDHTSSPVKTRAQRNISRSYPAKDKRLRKKISKVIQKKRRYAPQSILKGRIKKRRDTLVAIPIEKTCEIFRIRNFQQLLPPLKNDIRKALIKPSAQTASNNRSAAEKRNPTKRPANHRKKLKKQLLLSKSEKRTKQYASSFDLCTNDHSVPLLGRRAAKKKPFHGTDDGGLRRSRRISNKESFGKGTKFYFKPPLHTANEPTAKKIVKGSDSSSKSISVNLEKVSGLVVSKKKRPIAKGTIAKKSKDNGHKKKPLTHSKGSHPSTAVSSTEIDDTKKQPIPLRRCARLLKGSTSSVNGGSNLPAIKLQTSDDAEPRNVANCPKTPCVISRKRKVVFVKERQGSEQVELRRLDSIAHGPSTSKTSRGRVAFDALPEAQNPSDIDGSNLENEWSPTQKAAFQRQSNCVPANEPLYWESIAAGVEGKNAAQCMELWKSFWSSPVRAKRKPLLDENGAKPRKMKPNVSTPQVIRNVQKASKRKRSRETTKFRTSVRRLADAIARDTEDDALEPVMQTPKVSGKTAADKFNFPALLEGTPGTEIRQKRRAAEKRGELATPEILRRGKVFGLREADQYVSLFKQRLGAAAVGVPNRRNPNANRGRGQKGIANVSRVPKTIMLPRRLSASDTESQAHSESPFDGDLFF